MPIATREVVNLMHCLTTYDNHEFSHSEREELLGGISCSSGDLDFKLKTYNILMILMQNCTTAIMIKL